MVDIVNQESVRNAIQKYINEYGATWAFVAKETKISKPLLSIWKSGKTNLGLNNINSVVSFLKSKNIEI